MTPAGRDRPDEAEITAALSMMCDQGRLDGFHTTNGIIHVEIDTLASKILHTLWSDHPDDTALGLAHAERIGLEVSHDTVMRVLTEMTEVDVFPSWKLVPVLADAHTFLTIHQIMVSLLGGADGTDGTSLDTWKERLGIGYAYFMDWFERVSMTVGALREATISPQHMHRYGSAAATYRRNAPKTGRNSPCPCDSGRKFKKCCGRMAGKR